MSPIRPFRSIFNIFGLAWWARIESKDTRATYWFGPFLTKRSLAVSLPLFLEDLNLEGSEDIDHSFVRTRKAEPLTI